MYNDYSEPVVDVVKDKEIKEVKENKEKREDLPGINNSEDSALNYLKEILQSLYIEILDSDAENILDLIKIRANFALIFYLCIMCYKFIVLFYDLIYLNNAIQILWSL